MTEQYITQCCGPGHHFTVDPDPVPYPIFYFEGSSPDSDPTLSAEFRIDKFFKSTWQLKEYEFAKTKQIFCLLGRIQIWENDTDGTGCSRSGALTR
jgi:hypothetical protein